MKGIIFPLCAAVAWLTLLFRLRDLRSRWRDPTVVTLCVMVATLGITFTVATPAVAAEVDRLVGIPNVGAFCIHSAAVTCSFAVQILILLWARSAEGAWR